MSSMDNLAGELYSLMKESDERKPKPYDTTAEVVRVEEETVWVHIEGGVEETPVKKTIDAKKGDKVRVHVSNGSAWITGNESAPPTDDTIAVYATRVATDAEAKATGARVKADEASLFAQVAKESAIEAREDAAAAHSAANQAIEDAATAQSAAESAMGSATSAQTAADNANKSANSALTQLGLVEDVVGTLNWISEHATYKASTDTSVVDGKLYFIKSGDVYTPVANPTGNPSALGYYEIDSIDEAVGNYVSSHLALTNVGLWIINDNNSYRILLASDGMKVYDSSGNLVSTFGESITFSSTRAQYIGGENAYIVFNPTTGAMSIGGNNLNISGNVTIGGQTRSLTQVLIDMQSEIDGAIETWYYSVDPTLSNPPASNWTTESQRIQHLRDLYFNISNGHTFRWALISSNPNVYNWVEIEDSDAAAALRAAQAAQQTADGKVDPSSVIESINDSTETSTINANRVNIESAAIFTSGRLSSTSLNNAYDSKGSASSAQTAAINAAATDATTKANNAQSAAESASKTYTDTKTSDMATNTSVANTYATKASAISEEQRVYYRSDSTTTPTASSSWVTSTSTVNNTWTTKRMQYDTTYKYLYTCIQHKTVSGTITNTTVLLDDTTTVIDGGNIITGTVNANAINASSGTFDTANIPNLSADKITSGTINVGRLPSDVAMDTDVAEAAKKATDYITQIDANGIWVTPTNKKPSDTSTGAGATGTKIDGSGVGIYNSGTEIANYGSSARIGQSTSNNIQIGSAETGFYKNTTKVGYIKQTAYTPPQTGTQVANTMMLHANDMLLLDVGSETYPQIEIENDSVFSHIGDGSLSFHDYNGGPCQVQLEMPKYSRSNQTTGYAAYTDMGGVWLGIHSDGFSTGIKDGSSTGKWIICKTHNNTNSYVAVHTDAYNYTSSSSANLGVTSYGILYRSTSSSKRYKKDIEDIEGAEALYNVKVRQFKYRDDYLDSEDQRYDKTICGFIVEELEDIYPIAVDYVDELPEDWNVRYIVPPMLKLIQDQKKEIDELRERVDALERGK